MREITAELAGTGLTPDQMALVIELSIAAVSEGGVQPHYRGPSLESVGATCVYCGQDRGAYHLDHVVPRSRGGADHSSNIVIACAPCNLSKGAKLLSEWRSS